MKVLNVKRLAAMAGAGLIATVSLLPQARGELVYESNINNNQVASQVDDRMATRQALGASEKAQVTMQAQAQPAAPAATAPAAQPAAAPATVVQAPTAVEAPAAPAVQAAAPVETENLSKAELMRRERAREEIKNEDILQERLEELRLRDERKRTQEVLSAGAAAPADTTAAAAPQASAPVNEMVVAPVTDRSAKPALAPAPVAAAAPAVSQQGSPDAAAMSMAPMTSESSVDRSGDRYSDHTVFSITPRVGISNFTGDDPYFDVHPHYSAGIAASVSASDYIAFTFGYTYSQYGLSAPAYMGPSMETLGMNQNLFDGGLKLSLLGPDSRIRPFIGGGIAYGIRYFNLSSQVQAMSGPYQSADYDVSNFYGFLSSGVDVKVSKNISVGAEFRYYAAFSDSESTSMNNYFSNYNNAYNNGSATAGNTLARDSMYSILGNVSFSF